MSNKTLVILLTMIACGTVEKPPEEALEGWSGKSRKEVITAFSHLTPKTEGKRITFRDTDPFPTKARCAVVPCFPVRVDCRYVFKLENDRVVKATRSGKCREKEKKTNNGF